MKKNKILVTGTGRAGTTLLMKLFTDLGLNTGFKKDKVLAYPNEGLENLNLNQDVLIHKSPFFAADIRNLHKRFKLTHIIIPIRNLNHSAASRSRMGFKGISGGLWGADSIGEQKNHNATLLYNLMETVAEYDLNYTLLHFPSFAKDESILVNKLKWLWDSHNIKEDQVVFSLLKIRDLSKIHF